MNDRWVLKRMKKIVWVVLFSVALLVFGNISFAQSVDVAILDIQNDQTFVRTNEVASASVPIAISGPTSSLDPSYYGLVDQQGQRVPAQFKVVSRWNGTPYNNSLPIQWLLITTKTIVAANSTNFVTLRRYDDPVVDNAPLTPLQVQTTGDQTTIDTGVASFTLSNNAVDIISSVIMGGVEILNANGNHGPYVTYNGQQIYGVASSIEIEESGPIKTVIHIGGVFPGTVPNPCSGGSFDLDFNSRLTFTQGEGTVLIEHDIRNRCVRGLTDDVVNEYFDLIDLGAAGWNFDLNLTAAAKTLWVANDAQVFSTPGVANASQRVEQQRGNTLNPSGWRKSSIQQSGMEIDFAESYQRPIAAISDNSVTVAIQIPWMEYREPQALSVTDSSITLEFLSSTSSIGEAQTRWNFGLVSFSAQSSDSNYIQSLQQSEHVKQSRALLIHTTPAYTNSTSVMSRLPTQTSVAVQQYRTKIDALHFDTINIQWDQVKHWGAMLWPESVHDSSPNISPNTIVMDGPNFWAPDRVEVLEWFRTGEPQWFWDYVFMKQQLFLKTSVINSGRRDYHYRNGLTFGAGGQADGEYYRFFRTTTDDKQYVMGMDEGYLIRPSGALQDVFEAGGRTVNARYSPTGMDTFIDMYKITRQTVGYYFMPLYCVMFSQDPAESSICQNALDETMSVLSSRHMGTGLMCGDEGSTSPCTSDQLFMQASMHDDFFRGYIDHFPASIYTPTIRQALINTARVSYQHQAGGTANSFDMNSPSWETNFNCPTSDFNSCQPLNTTPGEPVYSNARTVALNMYMRAYELDPSLGYCSLIAAELDVATSFDFIYTDSVGWDKTNAQGMYMIHALGVAETCGQVAGSNPNANAGPDQIVIDSDENGMESIRLDGSGSTDDGSIVSYVWDIPGYPNANGVNPNVSLVLGIYDINLTVTDDSGATDTDTIRVEINSVGGGLPGVPVSDYTPMANESFELGFWFGDSTPQLNYANLLTTNSVGDTSCGSTDFATIRFYLQINRAGSYFLVDDSTYVVHEDGGCGAHDNNRFGIPATAGDHHIVACVSQADFSQNYCTDPLLVTVLGVTEMIYSNGFE